MLAKLFIYVVLLLEFKTPPCSSHTLVFLSESEKYSLYQEAPLIYVVTKSPLSERNDFASLIEFSSVLIFWVIFSLIVVIEEFILAILEFMPALFEVIVSLRLLILSSRYLKLLFIISEEANSPYLIVVNAIFPPFIY